MSPKPNCGCGKPAVYHTVPKLTESYEVFEMAMPNCIDCDPDPDGNHTVVARKCEICGNWQDANEMKTSPRTDYLACTGCRDGGDY